MQKAHIVYDGRIIEKYEFEMRVEEVELTPEQARELAKALNDSCDTLD